MLAQYPRALTGFNNPPEAKLHVQPWKRLSMLGSSSPLAPLGERSSRRFDNENIAASDDALRQIVLAVEHGSHIGQTINHSERQP